MVTHITFSKHLWIITTQMKGNYQNEKCLFFWPEMVQNFVVYTNLPNDHPANGRWKPFPVLSFLITCIIHFEILSYWSLSWLSGPLQHSLLAPGLNKHLSYPSYGRWKCGLLRWPRELNALQLQKTHANKENNFLNLTTHMLQMLTTQPKKETHCKYKKTPAN